MLKSSNRPRAPSAATLRVLYQLAYISSGAAFGVGALCAEERRRRTIIVQRIAENHRRLRQSPRYSHNVAAAIATTDHRPFTPSDQEGAPLDPYLPSVIEREYDRTLNHGEVRTRRIRKRLVPNSAASSVQTTSTDNPRAIAGRHGERPPIVNDPPLGAENARLKQPLLHAGLHNSQRLRDASPKTYGRADLAAHLDKDVDIITKRFGTRNLPKLESLSVTDLVELRSSLSREMRLFLQTVSVGDATSPPEKYDADTHANSLLRVARSLGNLRIAVSLIMWRIAVDRFTDADVQRLTDTYDYFLRWGVAWDVARPDGARCTGLLPESPRRADGTTMRPQGSPYMRNYSPDLPVQVWNGMSHDKTFIGAISLLKMISKTAQLCRKLASSGNLGVATYLLTALPLSLWQKEGEEDLIRSLFSYAIQDDDILLCDRLIKWTGGALSSSVLAKQDIIAYINMCLVSRSNAVVRSMFTSSEYNVRKNVSFLTEIDLLDYELCRRLCLVFSGDARTRHLLQTMLSRLSKDQRSSIRKEIVQERAANLVSEWKAKLNLDWVRKLYDQYLALPEAQNDPAAARILHVAMIHICLMAEKVDVAQEALSVLGKLSQNIDDHLISLHMAATSGDWRIVDKLLSIPEHEVSSFEHRDLLRIILRQYARTIQDADGFLALAFKLHDKLKATPTVSTHVLVLKYFALQERPDCIEHWLRSCDARRWPLQLSDQLVASLLREYAVGTKIDYSMLMGTAHELGKKAPDLVGERVRAEIETAIVTYIRKDHSIAAKLPRIAAGQRSSQTVKDLNISTTLAILRLQHLTKCRDSVPHPRVVERQMPSVYREDGRYRSPNKDLIAIIGRHGLQGAKRRFDETSFEGSQNARLNLSGAPVGDSSTTVHEFEGAWSWADGLSDEHSDDNIEPPPPAAVHADPKPVDISQGREALDEPSPLGPGTRLQQLRNEMLLALNRRQYGHVLQLFEQSKFLGTEHAPLYLLPIAVDASVRNTYDKAAQELLNDAEARGANPAMSAMPFYLHKLKAHEYDITGTNAAKIMRFSVMAYYKLAKQNAILPSFRVVNVAAHMLFKKGMYRLAIELYEAVAGVFPQLCRAPDVMIANTIKIKAYAAIDDVDGICNAVAEVLSSCRRIDQVIIDTLKLAEKSPWLLTQETQPGAYRSRLSDSDQERMRHARESLLQQQEQQKRNSSWFLPRLVNALVNYHHRVEWRSIQLPSVGDTDVADVVPEGPIVVQPMNQDRVHIPSTRRSNHDQLGHYEHLDSHRYTSSDRMVSVGA